ncbi:MAG: FitA-like ribbon-helix-helix domain-containing protein [Thermoanaerobaculia bacterium]
MAVDIALRDLPDSLVQRLKERAETLHRSLEGEIVALLEEALPGDSLTPREVLKRVRALGLETPAESATFIRSDRDSR